MTIENCNLCPLHRFRRNVVFGEGNATLGIMFVGEAPGEQEDKKGRPFVGPAGQILNEALKRIGINREDLYITNVVKCRTPFNRIPRFNEIAACFHYLADEIQTIRPRRIIALGRTAASVLLGRPVGISNSRGCFYSNVVGVEVCVTYHPGAILRNPNRFVIFVEDLERYLKG